MVRLSGIYITGIAGVGLGLAGGVFIGYSARNFRGSERKEIMHAENRENEAIMDSDVNEIHRNYERWLGRGEDIYRDWSHQSSYTRALKKLAEKTYIAKDILGFSKKLQPYKNRVEFSQTGLFLSAMINSSPDEEFEIDISNLDSPICGIGYKNSKRLIVNGNVMDNLGELMEKGSITVNGNAGSRVGELMEKGLITVKGNAGDYVGWKMKDGSILVHKNAGSCVGAEMEGGTIAIQENAKDNVGSQMKNGSITIHGDAGNDVGGHAVGGSIVVKGDARSSAGSSMKGGSIEICGDAEGGVGIEMENGSIIIRGNVKDGIGYRMEGGTINIEDGMGSISNEWRGGRIYHRGKLVRGK